MKDTSRQAPNSLARGVDGEARTRIAHRMLEIDAEIAALPPATMWDRVALILAGGVLLYGSKVLVGVIGLDERYDSLFVLLTGLIAFQFPIVRHGVTSSGRRRLRLEREQHRLAEEPAAANPVNEER